MGTANGYSENAASTFESRLDGLGFISWAEIGMAEGGLKLLLGKDLG
jgi:hypothetical protein